VRISDVSSNRPTAGIAVPTGDLANLCLRVRVDVVGAAGFGPAPVQLDQRL
jgi:hypothetical protein